jgi:hypothetical protein
MKDNSYSDFVIYDFERYIGWHERAISNPPFQYELVYKQLEGHDFGGAPRLVNFCAANGNLLAYLKNKLPTLNAIGIETVGQLVEHSSSQTALDLGISLQTVASYNSQNLKDLGHFNFAVHVMRLLHFIDWQEHLNGMLELLEKGGVGIISSLFNPRDVSLRVAAYDWNLEAGRKGLPLYYNQPSLTQVKSFLASADAEVLNVEPISMPFNIEKKNKGFGSHTLNTADGLQFSISGGMLLHWHLIKFRKR